jgi:hypothetical protein
MRASFGTPAWEAAGHQNDRRRSHDDARTKKPSSRSNPGPGRYDADVRYDGDGLFAGLSAPALPLPHDCEARVEHLRRFLGGRRAETLGADAVRDYQLHRRKQGAEAATINQVNLW